MKNTKSTLAVAILFVTIILIVFNSQPGDSQSARPPQSQSFNAHYAEHDFTIGAAVIDEEEGLQPASQSLAIPILNRAVRISLTFTGADGEMSFGEVAACYNSATGEWGFEVGNFLFGGSIGFPLLRSFPDRFYAGIDVVGGPNGTVQFQNNHTAPGSLHVALWY